jgi:predicted DNA-binding transcriptional regulator AlpA
MTRLTVKDAAIYVGLSRATLDIWRGKGRGPRYIKLGSRVVYDTGDLDRWLEQHKQSSTSDKPELRRRRRRSRLNQTLDVRR